MILAKALEDSRFKDQLGAGIVLTGGMTKLEGIRDLATAIFDNLPVRVAKPREMEGLFETLRDPGYSTAIGLVLYGGGHFTPYEIDSNKKLRYKNEEIEQSQKVQNILNGTEDAPIFHEEGIESTKEKLSNIAVINEKRDKSGFASKMWNSLKQLF